jgi:dienelactone hydrolase
MKGVYFSGRAVKLACVGVLMLCGWAMAVRAETPRVLPAGQVPQDRRLGELKTLNGYFPFTPPTSPDAWARRAERVRRQLLVATGLWPMPTKTPANPVVHGRVDRDGYTVERVYLESFPGHFVTGNLYRPKGRSGRLPGVLCPHGHWPNGRFYDCGEDKIRLEIVAGAERFERSGRHPTQARCVQLARMGCVVFHYDMVGNADSVQLAHSPRLRPEMNTPENWGYFSPQAELRLENMMGLQTYNSIRVLDWFSELADVDPKRIGVTGCSGGGTQTFVLCALDPRPAVAFPAVMVSTAMQGGCTCENACYLRVGTGNVEFAALFAPRPLGMTAADDWTKEIMTKGLPELKQLYKMLGAETLVMAKPLVHFPHNYNYVSRAVMYPWMNKHLKLGLREPIVEEDFVPLSVAEMTVWDESHPKPAGGPEYERSLLRWITEDNEKQMAALVPTDATSLARYREIVGGALDAMIGRRLPDAGAVQIVASQLPPRGDYRLTGLLVRYSAEGEEVPAIRLEPKQWNKQVVVWVDPLGKQGAFGDDGMPKPAVRKLLDAGMAVVAVDLFGQGEFTSDGKPVTQQRLVDKDKGYAGYTYGYNPPMFVQRVHDLLSVIAALKQGDTPAEKIHLVGLGGAGRWVAVAQAQAGERIDRTVVDTANFRFAKLTALDAPDFLPGGAKYLDLPGLLALSAPRSLWCAGEASPPPVVTAAYKAAGQPDRLTLFTGDPSAQAAAAVEWLVR